MMTSATQTGPHYSNGPSDFMGASGPATRYPTACDLLLKTQCKVTDDRERVRCERCRKAMGLGGDDRADQLAEREMLQAQMPVVNVQEEAE